MSVVVPSRQRLAREWRKENTIFQGPQTVKGFDEYHNSPNNARIVEKPSIASTSSYTFGGERMIRAKRGLLE
jgi:hypothetical protein